MPEYVDNGKTILSKSDKLFKIIFENVNDGIALADIETKKFCMSNQMLCEMTGYSQTEILKLSIKDLHPKKSLPLVYEKFQQQKKKTCPLAHDMPVKRKDGSVFAADINARPVEIGQKTYMLGIFRDVTQRNAARQDILKFKKMADMATYGCALVNTDGTIIYINNSFANMHGYTVDKLIGQNLLIFHTAEQQKEVIRINNNMAKTGDGLNGREIWHVHKNGTEFPTIMNLWTIKDPDGQTSLMCATAINITERKRIEKALLESEQKYRDMVEAINDALFVIDTKGKLLFANNIATEQLGYKPEQCIGKNIKEFFPPQIAERHLSNIQHVIKSNKKEVFESLTELKGAPRWYMTSLYPLRNAKGKTFAVQAIGVDITERKRLESQLAQYKEKVIKTQKLESIETMVAAISHELNQPLTVVNLLIDQTLADMKKAKYPAGMVKNLNDCMIEIKNAIATVTKARDKSYVDISSDKLDINIAEIAERILTIFAERARKFKVILHTKNLENIPLFKANVIDLEQIFYIFVENALDAAKAQKWQKLEISAKLKNKELQINFKDDCGGIPKVRLENIFLPFYSTKKHGKGNGLGLTIAKRILLKNGGDVTVKSTYRKGTVFNVYIPVNY